MSTSAEQPFFDACRARIAGLEPFLPDGRVHAMVGTVIEGEGISARIGSVCRIGEAEGGHHFDAEVVGFRDDRLLLMPLGDPVGIAPGARLRVADARAETPSGEACLGRVLDGLGRPIDSGIPLDHAPRVSIYGRPESAVQRDRVSHPLDLGIRSVNAFSTVGRGMRMGIFAGAGVGKSTLLGEIARQCSADVTVIALVGERRREVREFIERDLGNALERSVVVVSTSDEEPLLRVRAANVATSIAESFRDEGRHVLLIMDSLSRYCMALREIGLAAGEPPTTRGYTPSVWSSLPRLLERAGTSAGGGSVTGIYSVLVEGDDPNEPVADAARSMLDGHIVLSRKLAERGHYPAIDVLASLSRVMPDVVGPGALELAQRARAALATYRDAEDLIAIGAYRDGSDQRIDAAVRLHEPLESFLRQARGECCSLSASVAGLGAAMGEARP